MTHGLTSGLRLSAVVRLLVPVVVTTGALGAMPATGASADTGASIGISAQVCTNAPHCYWEDDGDWGSTTAVPSGATVFWRISITNTGSVALTNIVTNDAGNADCAGGVTAGPLQPGQVTAYSCQSNNVTAAATNTAPRRVPRLRVRT
jgi:hypothetical protein